MEPFETWQDFRGLTSSPASAGREATSMRRIMIMGPTGSGKSTLARLIGARYGLPVFHLDQAFHRPGWRPAPEEEFRAEVDRIAALPSWVIDGNYTATIEPRLRAADTLIYLDMPTWLTMARVLKRIVTSYGRVRPDAAPGCPERLNLPFLAFAWSWNRIRRDRKLALVARFSGRAIVLHGRAEQKVRGPTTLTARPRPCFRARPR